METLSDVTYGVTWPVHFKWKWHATFWQRRQNIFYKYSSSSSKSRWIETLWLIKSASCRVLNFFFFAYAVRLCGLGPSGLIGLMHTGYDRPWKQCIIVCVLSSLGCCRVRRVNTTTQRKDLFIFQWLPSTHDLGPPTGGLQRCLFSPMTASSPTNYLWRVMHLK